MSTDRRELLLSQLLVIAQGIPGIKSAARNKLQISAAAKPAIVVLDADEVGALGDFALGRNAGAPGIMKMSPEVCILAGGTPETVGTILNGFRLALILAVLTDGTLADVVTGNGGVQYQGCVTDLGQGRTLEGLMILNFELHYPLRPTELM